MILKARDINYSLAFQWLNQWHVLFTVSPKKCVLFSGENQRWVILVVGRLGRRQTKPLQIPRGRCHGNKMKNEESG